MQLIIILIVIAFAIAGMVLAAAAARKRRDAMQRVASDLGLIFYPGHDTSYDERYPFLNKLCQGSARYAFNIMMGHFRSHRVILFDYHYETYSRDSKGKRRTSHHYFSFFILNFHAVFPELLIAREGWMSKIAQFFGYEDIDFESAEFSRKFIVRSGNKKFAYDICHSQMIEFMLENPDLNIEIDRDCLTLFFPQRLTPEGISVNLQRLVRLREMFPSYLMER